MLQTVAIENKGVDALLDRIEGHREHLQASDEWLAREKRRSRQEMPAPCGSAVGSAAGNCSERQGTRSAGFGCGRRELTSYDAADKILERLGFRAAS